MFVCCLAAFGQFGTIPPPCTLSFDVQFITGSNKSAVCGIIDGAVQSTRTIISAICGLSVAVLSMDKTCESAMCDRFIGHNAAQGGGRAQHFFELPRARVV